MTVGLSANPSSDLPADRITTFVFAETQIVDAITEAAGGVVTGVADPGEPAPAFLQRTERSKARPAASSGIAARTPDNRRSDSAIR